MSKTKTAAAAMRGAVGVFAREKSMASLSNCGRWRERSHNDSKRNRSAPLVPRNGIKLRQSSLSCEAAHP